MGDLAFVAFYEKPFLKFDRLLHTYLACAPLGLRSFLKAIPVWIKEKIWMKELIRKKLDYNGPIVFPEHHESHAASAFFPSPFPEAAFLTIDGVGEWTTTSFGLGQGNQIEIFGELHFPHSINYLAARTRPAFAASFGPRSRFIAWRNSWTIRGSFKGFASFLRKPLVRLITF